MNWVLGRPWKRSHRLLERAFPHATDAVTLVVPMHRYSLLEQELILPAEITVDQTYQAIRDFYASVIAADDRAKLTTELETFPDDEFFATALKSKKSTYRSLLGELKFVERIAADPQDSRLYFLVVGS